MTSVEAIEEEIKQLTKEQLTEFRHWFALFDAYAWDNQIEEDAAAGKFDELAAEAIEEYKSGMVREI